MKMVIKSLCLIALIIMYSNCSEETGKNIPSHPQVSGDNVLSFLALGDSYTIGESVAVGDRWYIHLIDALKSRGVQINHSDVIAKTGWTTAELIKAIETSGNGKKYSVVSLLIGVNNQYRGQSAETYRKEFKSLLNIAVNFADGKSSNVVVLSIPDWGVTPYAVARNVDSDKVSAEINVFNDVAKEETDKLSITFLNITEISRQIKNQPSLIASDGLHYSGAMHKLWALEVLSVVEKIFK